MLRFPVILRKLNIISNNIVHDVKIGILNGIAQKEARDERAAKRK
jgi:hypothetical protein